VALERISLPALAAEADRYDEVVSTTPGIDQFCTLSDWVLSAQAAWSPNARTRILRGEAGYALFLDHTDPDGTRVLLSFDSMWGFTCPLAGPDPRRLVGELRDHLRETESTWQVLLLTGLDPGGDLYLELAVQLGDRYLLRQGGTLRRWLASLEGGFEGYLGRRTPKLRETLRNVERRAEAAGVRLDPLRIATPESAERVFQRMLDVEARSWKGRAETGLLVADMEAFYHELALRWARRGGLRAIFARLDDRDIAYIVGGTLHATYRGFQFSFDDECRALAPGNLLQLAQIRELCEEGYELYDLGIDMEYKKRWAETTFDTVTLAVIRP